MKVYYRVWLNNNANKYVIEGSEYLDIDSHRYKHKKIPIIVEEIDGCFYDVITGDEIVFNDKGLYPGLSYLRKEMLLLEDLSNLRNIYSELTEEDIFIYKNKIMEISSLSQYRFKRYMYNTEKIKEYKLKFRKYIESSDKCDK